MVDYNCKISPKYFLWYITLDHLLQNWLKSQFSRKFIHWLWTVQSTDFGFEGAKRSVMNGTLTEIISFRAMAERWKSLYFSVMKYFEFIILTRSVFLCSLERKIKAVNLSQQAENIKETMAEQMQEPVPGTNMHTTSGIIKLKYVCTLSIS